MKKTILLLLILITLRVWGQAEFKNPDLLSFEDGQVLFHPSAGSELSLCQTLFKEGKQSLLWQWDQQEASITLDRKIEWVPDFEGARNPCSSTFVFWAYSFAPSKGSLLFEFLKQGKVCSHFVYGLDFQGWHGSWIYYNRDMKGEPLPDMDQIRITAQGVNKGRIVFDLIIPSATLDLRSGMPNIETPFVHLSADGTYGGSMADWHAVSDIGQTPLTQEQIFSIEQMEKRYQEFYLKGKKGADLNTLQQRFDRLAISRNDDGSFQGKPIFLAHVPNAYYALAPSAEKERFAHSIVDLNETLRLLVLMAESYHLLPDPVQKQEVERMFLTLTGYLLDQGWSFGSSMGTIGNSWYHGREFYPAMFLMKHSLYQEGIGERVRLTMEWYSQSRAMKKKPDVAFVMDDINTLSMGRIGAILMMENSPEKVAYLKGFSRWVTHGLETCSPGLECGFKPDGSAFHHCNNYPAYARDGLRGGIESVYMLAHGLFAISDQGYERLKQIMLTMRFYCNLQTWPLAMSGRHPSGEQGLSPHQFAMLALAGTKNGQPYTDPDLANAYMRLTAVNPEGEYYQLFARQGFQPESSPEGTLAMPYACALIHRRDNWSVSVRAHSRYLWGSESYEGANLYGRYLGFGPLQIVSKGDPVSNEGSGFQQKGWDWNRWWGVTASILPIDQLKANIRNADKNSGYEEMLLSDESFAGPVSIGGKNGAFAFKLHEHDKYNGSLRARKSYFFIDNRVICLGSNIQSALNDVPTETTLFQEYIAHKSIPIYVNGEPVVDFPYQWTRSGDVFLTDAHNNAYFVRNGEVKLCRSKQHSFDEESNIPTENDFTMAAISHGRAPSAGRYEYVVLIDPSEDQLRHWSKGYNRKSRPLYKVIRQDSIAHIVSDTPSGLTGYAIFEAGKVATQGGVLESTHPLMIMTAARSDKTLDISVADPDLRLYQGVSDELYDKEGKRVERSIYSRPWRNNESGFSYPQVTVDGLWVLAEPSADCKVTGYRKGATVLEFVCRHGLSKEVQLIRK